MALKVKFLLIAFIVIVIICAPLISPYDPMAINLEKQALSPNWQHIMGTDMLGRDVLSRLLYGGRVSLLGSALATLIVVIFGTLLGIASGYVRGVLDEIVQLLIDVLLTIPNLIVALLIITLLGRGVVPAIVAVALSIIANYLQVARAAALTISTQEYIVVSQSLGATQFDILKRHVLPNCISILMSYAGVIFAYSLLGFTAIGFLGLSIELGQPEWGTMIADGFKYYRDAIWISAFPAMAISICVILINSVIDDFNQLI